MLAPGGRFVACPPKNRRSGSQASQLDHRLLAAQLAGHAASRLLHTAACAAALLRDMGRGRGRLRHAAGAARRAAICLRSAAAAVGATRRAGVAAGRTRIAAVAGSQCGRAVSHLRTRRACVQTAGGQHRNQQQSRAQGATTIGTILTHGQFSLRTYPSGAQAVGTETFSVRCNSGSARTGADRAGEPTYFRHTHKSACKGGWNRCVGGADLPTPAVTAGAAVAAENRASCEWSSGAKGRGSLASVATRRAQQQSRFGCCGALAGAVDCAGQQREQQLGRGSTGCAANKPQNCGGVQTAPKAANSTELIRNRFMTRRLIRAWRIGIAVRRQSIHTPWSRRGQHRLHAV